MRLHELARELGANSKDLLAIAKGIGMPIKSHSSSLLPGQVSLLKAAYLYADEEDEEALLQKIEDKEAERKKVETEEKVANILKAKERRQAEIDGESSGQDSSSEPLEFSADETAVSGQPSAKALADAEALLVGGPESDTSNEDSDADRVETQKAKYLSDDGASYKGALISRGDSAGDGAAAAQTADSESELAESSEVTASAELSDPGSTSDQDSSVESDSPGDLVTSAASDDDAVSKSPSKSGTGSVTPDDTAEEASVGGKTKKPADPPQRRGARILGRIELPGMNAPRSDSSGAGSSSHAPAARSSSSTSSSSSSSSSPPPTSVVPGRARAGTDEERERNRNRGRKTSAKKWQPNDDVEPAITSASSGQMGRVKFWQRGPARRPHGGGRGRGRGRGGKPAKLPTLPNKNIVINPPISVKDLSQALGIKANDILKKFLLEGIRGININSILDEEGVAKIAADFGREVDVVEYKDAEEQFLEDHLLSDEDRGDELQRAPVVTFLGHVDHGKTSLLDRIRSTNVADGEAGGITQHVRAYRVTTPSGMPITFLDTPGHRAFTEMRLRGAKMTDVAVLVVAADDGVMPQTEEAYHHLRAADPTMPIVVALNKIDKADANPMKAKQQLATLGLLPEEFGGETGVIEVSAITGDGIDSLLERLSLEAEVRELGCHPEKRAEGVVVEARKDVEIGIVATVLVQDGTLNVRDHFLCGAGVGRVRALYDDHGNPIESAGPSVPVLVVGFDEVPKSGDQFLVVENGKKAREVADDRRQKAREASLHGRQKVTLENLSAILAEAGQVHEIKVVLKADVQGSLEVVRREMTDLKHDEVRVRVLRDALGGITEDDVLLALASEAVVLGFNVIPDEKARQTADARNVEIRTYQVIYELLDDIKKAMEGSLKPIERENVLGHATIRQVFKVSRFGNIAGCMVTDGVIMRTSRIRLVRDGKIIFTGRIDTLKRIKDDAKEVKEGFECGIKLAGFNDIRVDDVIETFEVVEEKRELALN